MSRRRKAQPQAPQPRRYRNTHAERPHLSLAVSFLPEGKIEVEPKFNDALIEQLDTICAATEDYDDEWTDDHKIAYYVWTIMDGFLAQWDTPISPDEVDADVADVPHLKDAPVVDQLDIAGMEIVK